MRRSSAWVTLTGTLLTTFVLGAAGCANNSSASREKLEVEIGIPDIETRRSFEALDSAGTVYFSKGAQVQEFIMLAVRTHGHARKAFVEVTVTRDETGDVVSRSAGAEAEPMVCDDDDWCTLVPILLPASALGDLTELEGSAITMHATVWLESGAEGKAAAQGFLKFL